MPAKSLVTLSIPLSWETRHQMNQARHRLGETVDEFITEAVRQRLRELGREPSDNAESDARPSAKPV